MRKTIHDLSLEVHKWGAKDKPVLLWIHGWLDSGAAFQWAAASLQEKFNCLAPDLRGFGKSEGSPSALGYFFFEYVADMIALIQSLSPNQPIHLVGHSLGGAVAAVLAGSFPEKIKSLINVEGFGFQRLKERSGPQRLREWCEGLRVEPFPVYATFEEFMENLAQRHPRIPADRLIQWGKILVKQSDQGYQVASDPKHKWIDPYDFSQERFEQFWREYSFPTLFISADRSFMAPLLGEIQAKAPKEFAFEEIADCGHMIHLEKPEVLAQVMARFYERIS